MSQNSLSVGNALKNLRDSHGYKQEFVAHHLGITRSAYSHYETNRRMPDLGMILKICSLYQISVDSLLCGNSK